jgi:type II secretory pathway component GspD/PulD (secretin)
MRPALSAALLLALAALAAHAQGDKPADTPAAAKTRKLLKAKISVDFKDTRLEDAMDEIKEMVKGLKIMLDSKGGVSRNRTVTYTAKDKTVEAVFDEMFKKMGLGYIVISKKGNAYDGLVQVRMSDERGYEKPKK